VWSRRKAVGMLLVATAFVALEAEFLVSSLEPALEDLGLSELFVGLIVIPIIGNAAEHSSAIMFALRNKVDLTLEISPIRSARSKSGSMRTWSSSALGSRPERVQTLPQPRADRVSRLEATPSNRRRVPSASLASL
jgi:hypothetical protein